MFSSFTQFQESVRAALSFELWGNTGVDYFNAFIVVLVFYFALKIIKTILLFRLGIWAEKTKTKFDDHIVEILKGISNFSLFWIAILLLDRFVLSFQEGFTKFIEGVLIVLAVYEVIKIMSKVITYGFEKKLKGDETSLHAIMLITKIILWSVGLLLVLSNLGFDVTTLAASLGVGGIAVALAAQTILEDLFASFSIFFDKPFKIGDFIVIGTDKGTVKKIGLKTTRIQTLQGEELVVSNKELTTARVQNYKKMKKRRIDFTIGLVYGTPVKKLEEAKAIIQEIIDTDERTEFMRCHFKSFGDFSLNILTTYKINNGDINDYLDTQDTINLAIAEKFEKAGLSMAFPTQTIHVHKNS